MLLSWDFGMADSGCDPLYAQWNAGELLGRQPIAWHGCCLHSSPARSLVIRDDPAKRIATGVEGGNMTGRFPTPWRIVEIPSGFAVEDATGQQLGVFYGRADPNIAGHMGFLTMDEARQMAIDFARLPELLNGRTDE